ncbi:unnamed protein product, partial [Cladocopium goreaui]
ADGPLAALLNHSRASEEKFLQDLQTSLLTKKKSKCFRTSESMEDEELEVRTSTISSGCASPSRECHRVTVSLSRDTMLRLAFALICAADGPLAALLNHSRASEEKFLQDLQTSLLTKKKSKCFRTSESMEDEELEVRTSTISSGCASPSRECHRVTVSLCEKMQEDKTCQEQDPSVGVGGEGQIEGAGQADGPLAALLNHSRASEEKFLQDLQTSLLTKKKSKCFRTSGSMEDEELEADGPLAALLNHSRASEEKFLQDLQTSLLTKKKSKCFRTSESMEDEELEVRESINDFLGLRFPKPGVPSSHGELVKLVSRDSNVDLSWPVLAFSIAIADGPLAALLNHSRASEEKFLQDLQTSLLTKKKSKCFRTSGSMEDEELEADGPLAALLNHSRASEEKFLQDLQTSLLTKKKSKCFRTSESMEDEELEPGVPSSHGELVKLVSRDSN